jgi:hypothetical protein
VVKYTRTGEVDLNDKLWEYYGTGTSSKNWWKFILY